MNEWWLLVSFILLGLFALVLVLYPLRKSALTSLIVVLSFIILVSLSYWRWGAWPDWRQHLQEQAKQLQAQALLSSMKNPNDLVDTMKARLKENPDSAKGWYLLGRLYASQNQWLKAHDAFVKAHHLDPQDEAATVNYGQSLWQLNHQHFDKDIRKLFTDLLSNNPTQPDALAMLAMDAYTNHHYQEAINYWQQLLKLAPEQSEEAQMIRKAIAKAQQALS